MFKGYTQHERIALAACEDYYQHNSHVKAWYHYQQNAWYPNYERYR